MKKIMLLLFLLSVLPTMAREPYGDYICRYIVVTHYDKAQPYQEFIPTYNPLKITHVGIMVKNTNTGTKTWEAHYNGRVKNTYKSGATEIVHNFTLIHQHVEFDISDKPSIKYKGKNYHFINIDGQMQLAEPLY